LEEIGIILDQNLPQAIAQAPIDRGRGQGHEGFDRSGRGFRIGEILPNQMMGQWPLVNHLRDVGAIAIEANGSGRNASNVHGAQPREVDRQPGIPERPTQDRPGRMHAEP
jgi:hypothetical protein